MRILFFDCSPKDYTVESVYQKPMGGSESALCYLTQELAKLGHNVSFLNWTTTPGTFCGVACHHLNDYPQSLIQGADFAVFLNYAEVLANIRPLLDPKTKMVFWTQNAHDQGSAQPLSHPEIARVCDHIVCVSQWQKNQYAEVFGIDAQRITVLRNAISRPFEGLFNGQTDVVSQKLNPPTLVYTSTPFRGLDWLLEAYPLIRQQVPDVRLQVYSSMKVYGVSEAEDATFNSLYEKCRTMDGVDYFGSIPQKDLAQKLKSATILAYPNTFAETSCIAVLEALAAGLTVVSSDLGALSETGQGFAKLIPVRDRKSVV